MEMFNDNPENLEFDWFPEFSDNSHEIDFNTLVDFENELNETIVVEMTENQGAVTFFVKNHEVCENSDEATYKIFAEVSENLTGYEINSKSEFLYDYIEELNSRCTVIQSNLNKENTNETNLKIQMCLDDGGCVIGIIDGEQWDIISRQDNTQIGGMRTILITDINDDNIVAHDLTISPDESISIPITKLSNIEGIMLEVYK